MTRVFAKALWALYYLTGQLDTFILSCFEAAVDFDEIHKVLTAAKMGTRLSREEWVDTATEGFMDGVAEEDCTPHWMYPRVKRIVRKEFERLWDDWTIFQALEVRMPKINL